MGQNRKVFEDGITVFNAENMNALLQMQDGALICSGGTLMDSKTGAGVSSFSLASYSRAIRITATGQTEIGYVMLAADADGSGADMSVDMRSGFNPDGSTMGTVLASRIIPREFIPMSVGAVLVPFAVSGLTAGAYYWIVINRAGDDTNKINLRGEASQDAAHPAYRRTGTSGAWEVMNAIHFEVYSWSVDGDVLAAVDGGQWDWLEYSAGDLVKVKSYTPGVAGSGIREVLTLTNVSGALKKWVVT